ncbi:6670_t:CDS:2, partial [Dentiscutata heterogama]
AKASDIHVTEFIEVLIHNKCLFMIEYGTNTCSNVLDSAKTIKKTNSQHLNTINLFKLKTKQGIIDNYVNKIYYNEILDLEYKFARAVFASAKLSEELLNKVYEDVKKEIEDEISKDENINVTLNINNYKAEYSNNIESECSNNVEPENDENDSFNFELNTDIII